MVWIMLIITIISLIITSIIMKELRILSTSVSEIKDDLFKLSVQKEKELKEETIKIEAEKEQKTIENHLEDTLKELANEKKIFTIVKENLKPRAQDFFSHRISGGKRVSSEWHKIPQKERRIYIGFDEKQVMMKLYYEDINKFKQKYPSVLYQKVYNMLNENQKEVDVIKDVIKLHLLETISQHTMDLLVDNEEGEESYDVFGKPIKPYPTKLF